MGWLEGMLGGFVEGRDKIVAENQRQSDLAAQRESNLYKTLLNSDDPHAQMLGLSGMVESMNPRKRARGLGGWMGEMEQSPTYGAIQQYLRTPQTKTIEENVPTGESTLGSTQRAGVGNLPSERPSPGVSTEIEEPPAAAGSAAQPPGAQVTGTANTPPPTMRWSQPVVSPPQPVMMKQTRQVTGPRSIFLTPMERVEESARAKVRGGLLEQDEELRQLGASEDEIKQARLTKLQGLRAGAGLQSIQGEMPDGKGGWTTVFGNFNHASGGYTFPGTNTPIPGFRPRTTTASVTLGADRETFARIMFGTKASELHGDQLAMVEQARQASHSVLTTGQALSHAQRMLPNATLDKQLELADALKAGSTASQVTGVPVVPQTFGAPGAPPAASPGAASAPAGTPAATAPPAAPSAGPLSSGPSGSPAAGGPPAAGGARPPLNVTLPPGMGSQTKDTGKPLPPQTQLAVAKAQSTNDLIDQALAALEPYKNSNSLDDSLKLAANYRAGKYDPLTSAAVQLADLAGLQQSAQAAITGGSSRSMRVYVDRRQHVPKIPSYMQTHMPLLRGSAVQWLSGAMGGLRGASDEYTFDSPAAMYNKLVQAKDANQNFLRDIQTLSQGGGAVRPGAPAGNSGQAYQDANGVWRVPQQQ